MTIETKYNVGDEVWRGYDEGKPTMGIVRSIRVDAPNQVLISYRIDFETSSRTYDETELYPSAQAYYHALADKHEQRANELLELAQLAVIGKQDGPTLGLVGEFPNQQREEPPHIVAPLSMLEQHLSGKKTD